MKKLLILTLATLILSSTASAAGIQVSPSGLDFTIGNNRPVSQDIVVANPTPDVHLFQVYVDNFSDAVTANPASFTLEAGARKTVNITVHPKILNKSGGELFNTNLSVVSKPLADTRLEVGTGVKLPITVTLAQGTKNNALFLWIFAGILIFFLGLAATWYITARRHKKSAPAKT
jgi:P pilus assembly chaperone PapD